MQIVSGAMYKDSTVQDFAHYFNGTALSWKISSSKRRLFVVSPDNRGGITGQYLTRENKWKTKQLPFDNWWDSLDVILPGFVAFNTPTGAGIWNLNLSRSGKKSFPFSTNKILFMGPRNAEEMTSQAIGRNVFCQLYNESPLEFSLKEALASEREATVSKEGFVINKALRTVDYRTTRIGILKDRKIVLNQTLSFFKKLIERAGITDVEVETKESTEGCKYTNLQAFNHYRETGGVPWAPSMAQNPDWVNGIRAPWARSYIVYNHDLLRAAPDNEEWIRSYSGWFPGQNRLMPGWRLHNVVGHTP